MNSSSKNKWLLWLVLLLVVANIANISLFWINKKKQLFPPPPPKEAPADFLVRELSLDQTQQASLQQLISDHRKAAENLREKVKEAKDNFFDLLKQTGITDSTKQTAATNISRITEQLDLLTLDHFQKVRALCNPGQQKIFDSIIHQVTGMMGPPRPPMPGGPMGPPPGKSPRE